MMLATPDTFWIGFWIAVLTGAILLCDWLWLSRQLSILLRAAGSLCVLILLALTFWLAFRPVPLRVLTITTAENYAPGTVLHGIKWDPGFSEIDLTIANDTSLEYRNVDAYFRTDLTIAASGVHQSNVMCSVTPEDPRYKISDVFAVGKDKSGREFRFFGDASKQLSSFSRIFCSSLPPHSSLTVTYALTQMMPVSSLGIPLTPTKPDAPKWSAIEADYEAANRKHYNNQIRCESVPCAVLPDLKDIGFLHD